MFNLYFSIIYIHIYTYYFNYIFICLYNIDIYIYIYYIYMMCVFCFISQRAQHAPPGRHDFVGPDLQQGTDSVHLTG